MCACVCVTVCVCADVCLFYLLHLTCFRGIDIYMYHSPLNVKCFYIGLYHDICILNMCTFIPYIYIYIQWNNNIIILYDIVYIILI